MVEKQTNDALISHADSLQLLSEKLFSGVLTIENVKSKKKTIKVGDDKFYGYFLEKGNSSYFLKDLNDHDKSVLDILPIKITSQIETDYNRDVFFFITNYISVKIPEEPKMDFRNLVNVFANFKHTNQRHWLLYKIITIAAWADRINYRVIAERGFGKDSSVNNIRDLVGNTANIYGATFAKLEYSLLNKFLIFNEMGNLKEDDKINMQQFLLAIGAMFNKYSKRSRASESLKTKEEYDMSKTSLAIIYNPPIYYIERGQEFFDTMFTQAVTNRFIPFYLEGMLDEKFDAEFDTEKVVEDNMDLYKNIISTLRWYKKQTVRNSYTIPDDCVFDEKTRRYERSFLKICDYISEYAGKDEKLYYELVYELYNSYKNYEKILAESILAGKKIGKEKK